MRYEKALNAIAFQLPKKPHLIFVFHSFRNDLHC